MHSEASSKSNKNIFILAGEESGDVHGSQLVKEMLKIDSEMVFTGHGGNKMQKAGVKIIEHISKLSLVGITEVLKHLPYMRKVMNRTIDLIKELKPVRVILIDYPGFNLRLAKKLKSLNVPVTYFILPQTWAWKEKRYKTLLNCADQLISIIPFEKEWFSARNIEVEFVGNPLLDSIVTSTNKQKFLSQHNLKIDRPLLMLLPGSRQQEINRHWPIFLKTIDKLRKTFTSLQFILGQAPNVIIDNIPEYVKIETEHVGQAMQFANAGLVASGTASLEATLYKMPCVVCYKTSGLTHLIGKRLARVKYLSLTNLIAGEKIISEFIQNDMNPDNITKALMLLLSDTPEREKLLEGYDFVIEQLGKPGTYKRAAEIISAKL